MVKAMDLKSDEGGSVCRNLMKGALRAGSILGTGDFFFLIFFMMMMVERYAVAQTSSKPECRCAGMSAGHTMKKLCSSNYTCV